MKSRLHGFQLKRGVSIDEHMNNYTKLLIDLVNIDVAIKEEDKTLILLNFLPDDEYETFILILINGKQTLNYSDVSAAFVNYEVSSSNGTSAEALKIRGRGSNRKGKGKRGRSKSKPDFRDLKRTSALSAKN